MIDDHLHEEVCRLRTIADTGGLIVVLDFDGVLAPLVDDPAASRPLPAERTS